MSEQTIENPQQYPEQLSDVLLVMDKEKRKSKRSRVLTKTAI